jgi:hypothetical protein
VLKAYLIDQPAQQPQAPPASAQLVGVAVCWEAGWRLRAMIQHRGFNPVIVNVDDHWIGCPALEPYSTALVAASWRAKTTSSATSSDTPRRSARTAWRSPASRDEEAGTETSIAHPPSGYSIGLPIQRVTPNMRKPVPDRRDGQWVAIGPTLCAQAPIVRFDNNCEVCQWDDRVGVAGARRDGGVAAAGETPTVGVVVESRTDAHSTSRLAR